MTHETQSLPVTVALAHQDATLIDASGVGKSTYLCSPVLSIYVQFETLQEDARVTETSLREVFEPFGLVTGENDYFRNVFFAYAVFSFALMRCYFFLVFLYIFVLMMPFQTITR